MKKTFLFTVLTVFLFFILTDLGLRLILAPPLDRPFEWPPPDMTKHGLEADNDLFWKLRPGYNEPWRLYKLAYTAELASKMKIDFGIRKKIVAPLYEGVTWEINKQGFRGPSVPTKKKADTLRLLFVGSSITFGWGVPAQSAFPEQVRQGLEQRFPGKVYQAINAGVPGYSTHQGLHYLKKIVPQYRPDIVFGEFGINDGTMAVAKPDKEWHPRFIDTALPWIRKSGWGRLVLKIAAPDTDNTPFTEKQQTGEKAENSFYRVSLTGTLQRVSEEDYRSNLEEMDAFCEQRSAIFFPVIPALFNEYGDGAIIAAVNMSTPSTISFHDILKETPRDTWNTLFLPYDEGHLSRKGHRQVAKHMISRMAPFVLKVLYENAD